MGTNRSGHLLPRACVKWLCLSLVGLAPCPMAFGQIPSAAAMIESMKSSLTFPPSASMRLAVESKGAWHNAPEAEVAPYSLTRVDRWEARSDGERYGKELHRESPAGSSRSRTVYVARQQWLFEFDADAPPEAPILGRLLVRSQYSRGVRWRVPVIDYFDRAFVVPGRFPGNYRALDVAREMAVIDGHSCYEVRGAWNNREFSFWLDPEYGWLPRQYIMHLDHRLKEPEGEGGASVQEALGLIAPPEMQDLLEAPLTTEERMSGVVLERLKDRSYIARATLDKTVVFTGGVSHTEHLSIQTTDFVLSEAPDAGAFLAFDGLLRDGTPVEERVGLRSELPERVNYYVWQQGQFIEAEATSETYWPRLWNDLKVLATDFSVENFRRLDSKFLIAVCAVSALTLNGAMAYAAHRRNKTKTL